MSSRARPMSTSGRNLPRCADLDLDALAYGELAPRDELLARSHIALCQPCHRAHDELLSERRRFSARARASQPATLPSFDQLLARAESEPVGLRSRWQAVLHSFAAPWRGAVLQGAVGMFAVGMLVQVAILRPSRPVEGARPRASAAATQGDPSATLDPSSVGPEGWGESIADGACAAEAPVCVAPPRASLEEQALALGGSHAPPPANDPCAGAQAPVSIDWSLQPSSALESPADGVCAPDAI